MRKTIDYRRIAALEYELWGQVYTAEAKQYMHMVYPRTGSRFSESDATKNARAADMERMLAETGVE